MKDSIVVDMRYVGYDIIDGSPSVERHHIFGATNRSKSDSDGLWVPLSHEHHQGKQRDDGAHAYHRATCL